MRVKQLPVRSSPGFGPHDRSLGTRLGSTTNYPEE